MLESPKVVSQVRVECRDRETRDPGIATVVAVDLVRESYHVLLSFAPC